MKHKKPQSDPALICVFIVAILCGITEWVLTPKTALGDEKANEMCIVKEIPKVEVIENIYPLSVESQIREIARKENFKWPDYLVKLAYCESRLDPKAINTRGNNPTESYDRGLFQFNSYWQSKVSDECAFDIECSTKKTMEMINNGKQHLWACNDIVLNKK